MARKFLVSLDLNKNELLNARLQNLSSDPSSPVAGQIYYNTAAKETRFYDGTQWIAGGATKYGTLSSRPVASKGGILYVATDTQTLYIDNGTSWVQISVNPQDLADAINNHNNETSGVHGVTGDVVGTSDSQDLSNKRIIDTLYFTDGVTINNEGEIAIRSGSNDFDIQANYGDLNLKSTSGNVNIVSNNADIILNPDGSAYIGSVGTNNRIATIGDLNSDAVVQSVSGSNNQIVAANVAGDITLTLASETHIKRGIDQYPSIILNADSATISLNDPVADERVLDIYNSDSNAMLQSQFSLNLGTNNGDISLNPDSGVVNIGSGYGELHLQKTEYSRGNNLQGIIAAQSDGSLRITGNNNGLQLETNNGDVVINSASGNTYFNNVIRIDSDGQISTETGDLILSPDTGKVVVNNELDVDNIKSHNNGDDTLTINGGNSTVTFDNGTGNIELSPDGIVKVNGNQEITGNLTVDGNVNINGTLNAVNRTEVNIEDNTIVLNTNFTGTPTTDAGITVNRGDEPDTSVTWSESNDVWTLTNDGSNYHAIARKFAANIGDGTALTYVVEHNLGTKDLTIQIFENSADYNQIEADVQHTSTSTVTVKFAAAPSLNEYRVVIVG
jgi:hypothetical protein